MGKNGGAHARAKKVANYTFPQKKENVFDRTHWGAGYNFRTLNVVHRPQLRSTVFFAFRRIISGEGKTGYDSVKKKGLKGKIS